MQIRARIEHKKHSSGSIVFSGSSGSPDSSGFCGSPGSPGS